MVKFRVPVLNTYRPFCDTITEIQNHSKYSRHFILTKYEMPLRGIKLGLKSQ